MPRGERLGESTRERGKGVHPPRIETDRNEIFAGWRPPQVQFWGLAPRLRQPTRVGGQREQPSVTTPASRLTIVSILGILGMGCGRCRVDEMLVRMGKWVSVFSSSGWCVVFCFFFHHKEGVILLLLCISFEFRVECRKILMTEKSGLG